VNALFALDETPLQIAAISKDRATGIEGSIGNWRKFRTYLPQQIDGGKKVKSFNKGNAMRIADRYQAAFDPFIALPMPAADVGQCGNGKMQPAALR